MKELQQFPECDGHIECILIGMTEQNSVFGDISEYTVTEMNDGFI